MTNQYRAQTSHSAEYFGDTRDYWWNLDFLGLIAVRLAFAQIGSVLDVGCGVGHWGQLLARVLPPDTRVHGVDRDPHWVEQATTRAAACRLDHRCRYSVSTAERLPFADASFDLVTCQTLLIHVADPAAVIAEMARVTRPGGLVLAAEPNNMSSALVLNSVSSRLPPDEILAGARLQLLCERGKASLGEGNNSIGDLIPGLFAAGGLADVRVYLNDKTNPLIPPYDTAEQRAMLEECSDMKSRDFWIWSRNDTHRFFLAGGGREDEFDRLWASVTEHGDELAKAIADHSYSGSGASIQYIVAGRRE
ncbi:class I SAM-dependent methyltransferase [Bradyrhizobium acaciae]|uniref:class I SAM-dependent methyltransferase n=1 Tax=Bradyrhizobium acaciae TaxID=2683706 RepID=UPI001E3A9AF1|nr:methyltransferase domain-containing protein [Bradyrhizobium acaciae]MCC8983488.1 methyltransferase domain-containing protein [Bradyrhizobium acaciae]